MVRLAMRRGGAAGEAGSGVKAARAGRSINHHYFTPRGTIDAQGAEPAVLRSQTSKTRPDEPRFRAFWARNRFFVADPGGKGLVLQPKNRKYTGKGPSCDPAGLHPGPRSAFRETPTTLCVLPAYPRGSLAPDRGPEAPSVLLPLPTVTL